MKTGIFTLLIILLQVVMNSAAAQQSAFETATEHLQQNEYRKALAVYDSLEFEGYEAGALFFNQGVAYIKLDSLGKAKYYFLKANQYPETKPIAVDGLAYVNERFSRRSVVLPTLPWQKFIKSVSEWPGRDPLLISGLILFNLSVLFYIWSWFRLSGLKLLRYLSALCLVLSILFIVSGSLVYYMDYRYDTGVMISRQTQIYEQPDASTAPVSTVYEGFTMRVDVRESENREGWHYVRLENGMFGWIEEDQILTL